MKGCRKKVKLEISALQFEIQALTTYVPAILSCHPCLFLSMRIQMKPRRITMADMIMPIHRRKPFPYPIGYVPSVPISLIFIAIIPGVWPFPKK